MRFEPFLREKSASKLAGKIVQVQIKGKSYKQTFNFSTCMASLSYLRAFFMNHAFLNSKGYQAIMAVLPKNYLLI